MMYLKSEFYHHYIFIELDGVALGKGMCRCVRKQVNK